MSHPVFRPVAGYFSTLTDMSHPVFRPVAGYFSTLTDMSHLVFRPVAGYFSTMTVWHVTSCVQACGRLLQYFDWHVTSCAQASGRLLQYFDRHVTSCVQACGRLLQYYDCTDMSHPVFRLVAGYFSTLTDMSHPVFRPVAGYFSICPESIADSWQERQQLLSTMKHEILHALVKCHSCVLGKEWKGGRHACAWWFVEGRGTVQAGWGYRGCGCGWVWEICIIVCVCWCISDLLSYACVSVHCVSIWFVMSMIFKLNKRPVKYVFTNNFGWFCYL